MAKPKKITQNINKDAGLLDEPNVKVPHSQWETKHSNYLTCNIGEIVPIYVDEVVPGERRKVTMGQLSHMTTPKAPIFNAQYTEFRAFFVPYRLCADLLSGYKTRKSPWVKVFGEDNASTNANIVVPLNEQKLPSVSLNLKANFISNLKAFGGLADSLDYDIIPGSSSNDTNLFFSNLNFLDMAGYELIYQKAYRNQNRESATNSNLYKWLFDLYNRTSSSVSYDDSFHVANREKDYFTGSQPMTQKGDPVSVGLVGSADVGVPSGSTLNFQTRKPDNTLDSSPIYARATEGLDGPRLDGAAAFIPGQVVNFSGLKADLSSASGVNIEQLRIMIKTQELLEKDLLWGSDYASSLNAHFGCSPMSLVLEEPLELKKTIITSTMQPVLQSSSTANEETILGSIGANATTQSGEFEIVPLTKFYEYGLIIICATHKAQNSYDSLFFKPKRIFKKSRFDFYTPELNDLGYQPVSGLEMNYSQNGSNAVSFNEAFAEYRFKYNKVHGMFEPSRQNALDFWTLALSNYSDIQSMYKQDVTELNRAISVTSSVAPQFFDAYGFIEYNDKPMSLHSIPGMDGVI